MVRTTDGGVDDRATEIDDPYPHPANRVPEYDPDTMTIHECERCGNYEPVADGFRGTPSCHSCAGLLKPNDDADQAARLRGFRAD